MLPRGGSTNPQPRFHCGRPAIVELETAQVPWQDFCEFLHQPGLDLGREVMAIHELSGVGLDRFSYLRVAVAQRSDIDTGGEVDVPIAIDINQGAAFA